MKSLREQCVELFAWWLGELRDLADLALGRLFPKVFHPLVVRVKGTQLVARDGEPLPGGETLRGSHAIAIVDAANVLICEIDLPLAVERDLEPAIELHLERDLPLPRDRVSIDWEVLRHDRAKGRITVGVRIARYEVIETLRQMAAEAGLRLVRLAMEDSSGQLRGNLLPRGRHVGTLRLTSLDRKLLWVVCALATIAAGTVGTQRYIERAKVGAELERVRARADAVRVLSRELTDASRGTDMLVSIMSKPDAVDVLSALTATTPQDAWAFDLEVKRTADSGFQVKLGAFAPAATTLVETLEQSARFEQVRLISATSAGLGSGRDRLTLTARYAAP